MKESDLLKLALISSLTGVLLIIIISNSIEIKEYKINEITEKELEKEVKIKGTINRITETPGLMIINIKDETGTITAIIFKEESLNFTKNQEIELQGKVRKYKEKLEIVVNELKTI